MCVVIRPPDITPVVRADVRRLTYAELAAVRGISRASRTAGAAQTLGHARSGMMGLSG